MDLQLSGKTAIVTGASRGIGLAVVRALTAEGVRVVTGSRSITPELKETGAIPVSVDLSTAEGAEHLVERALDELGGIDLLVNNAGGGDISDLPEGGFTSVTDRVWDAQFQLNFFGVARVIRAALPSLLERRGGIINVSSIGARVPGGGVPVSYTTAKAAVTALGKALAEEVGPQGVRVNTVSPGPVRTAIWDDPNGFAGQLAQRAGVTLEQFIPGALAAMGLTTGRLIEPEEVAALIAYLASPTSASITGTDLIIDGGAIKTV